MSSYYDCSYALIDGFYYSPLETCYINGNSTKSRQPFCDTNLDIVMNEWISNTNCSGAPSSSVIVQAALSNCDTECSDDVGDIAAGSYNSGTDLLPGPNKVSSTTTTIAPTTTTTYRTSTSTHTANTLMATIATKSTITNQSVYELSTNGHIQTQVNVFASPSIPIHVICLLISLALFVGCIYHSIIKKHPKKQIVSIKIFVLLTFMSNIIGIVCIMMISILMTTAEWTQKTYNIALIPYYGMCIAYCFGKFNLECFFLFRVYIAFKQSAFSLSKGLCVTLICCMFIVSFIWCYMFLQNGYYVRMPHYVYILVSVLEICLIFVLLYLFLKRLSQLILVLSHGNKPSLNSSRITTIATTIPDHESSQPPSTKSKVSTIVTTLEHTLSTRQVKWVFLITRCILLSSISLITTMFFGIFAFYTTQSNYSVDIFIVYALWSIDMTANSACLYLNFPFANILYDKTCSCCHNLCQRMVEFFAVRKIFKKHMDDVKKEKKAQHIFL